jgi:hypothetical protein
MENAAMAIEAQVVEADAAKIATDVLHELQCQARAEVEAKAKAEAEARARVEAETAAEETRKAAVKAEAEAALEKAKQREATAAAAAEAAAAETAEAAAVSSSSSSSAAAAAAANLSLDGSGEGGDDEDVHDLFAPSANVDLGEMPTDWIQCRRCRKWRAVAWWVDNASLTDTWSCELNDWDPSYASCSVVEDAWSRRHGLSDADPLGHDFGVGEGGDEPGTLDGTYS